MKRDENFKIGAKILLICLALSIVIQLITVLQVKFQIVGDFIPQSIIWSITKKNIIVSLVSTLIGSVTWIIYFNKRYIIVMGLVGITIIWQQIYLSLN